MSRRALLVDPLDEAALTELGFVVVDLFTAEDVAALRAWYASVDHEITTDRSFAAGFHATIIDERPEYRARAFAAVADVCDEPFRRLLVDLDLVMVNWLHKEPDAAAVPFHVDWTMVDEQVHRSISVWAPLVDTDAESGAIGVVAASHHAVDFIRAAAHPSYHDTDAFGRGLPHRQLVPLKAGQAVVFDHRLVHFSAPHLGREPRVAISCELVPHEAEILHFEQLAPGRFLRHHVDAGFFVTYAAGQDPTGRPGHLAVTEVAGTSFEGAPAPEAAPGSPLAQPPLEPPRQRTRGKRLLPFWRARDVAGGPRP